MSKLGKRYNLFSETGDFKNSARLVSGLIINYNCSVENITETFDTGNGEFNATLEISGDSGSLTNLESYIKENDMINKESVDINFNIDTHYEQLKELANQKVFLGSALGSNGVVTGTLGDSLNLYKFKNSLEYNFLVKGYEEYLKKNTSIQEKQLPSFYEVLEDYVDIDQKNDFDFSIFDNPEKYIVTGSNIPKIDILPYKALIKNKETRIDKYLEKYNGYKEQFPFYADITFDTHPLSEQSVTNIINEKNLFEKFFDTQINTSASRDLYYNRDDIIDIIKTKEMNFNNFLLDEFNSFTNNDLTYIFQINQILHNKSRNFINVLLGQPEYSEVVGYHLKKYDQPDSTDTLQEWIFPNISNSKMFWVDTQIKYNKNYTYKIDPIILTFANEHKIIRADIISETGRLKINFSYKPIIKIYVFDKLKNFNSTTLGAIYENKLLDYPPTEPEIEIVPFIGVDSQIKINLNTSIGLKTVPAVDFSSDEDIKKDELRKAQNKDPNISLLTFQSDEPADFMEIYRIDTKPFGYPDFYEKLLVKLSTNKSSAASYIDTIEPNKKYYYIARCIDYHENFSNPTPVYEVELVNDAGHIIPNIKIVEFDKKEIVKQNSKSFKRFLKIQPAIRHKLVNADPEKDNIELGKETLKPWLKKFKLRLTSKSTGKKIDINFGFKYDKP